MRSLALVAFCAFATVPASAQQTTHAFFGELGGSGGFFSANYEFSPGHLALRTGVGTVILIGPTLNLTTALRLGRRRQWEVGGGILSAPLAPVSVSRNWPTRFIPVVAASGLVAYRWNVPRGSPSPSHFMRVAFTPFVAGDGAVVPWVGVAVGVPPSRR